MRGRNFRARVELAAGSTPRLVHLATRRSTWPRNAREKRPEFSVWSTCSLTVRCFSKHLTEGVPSVRWLHSRTSLDCEHPLRPASSRKRLSLVYDGEYSADFRVRRQTFRSAYGPIWRCGTPARSEAKQASAWS